MVRGREWALAGKRSWQVVDDWTAESWRGTTDRGSQHRTPETVEETREGPAKKIESKDVGIPVLVEFSQVTHASDSPHMHVELQYLLFALG